MIKVHELIHRENAEDGVKLLLQVHDELLFEIEDPLVKDWSVKIKDVMENVHKLDIPLVVDVKCGKNWAESESV